MWVRIDLKIPPPILLDLIVMHSQLLVLIDQLQRCVKLIPVKKKKINTVIKFKVESSGSKVRILVTWGV